MSAIVVVEERWIILDCRRVEVLKKPDDIREVAAAIPIYVTVGSKR